MLKLRVGSVQVCWALCTINAHRDLGLGHDRSGVSDRRLVSGQLPRLVPRVFHQLQERHQEGAHSTRVKMKLPLQEQV